MADQTLIEGAYRAAKASQAGKLAGPKAVMGMTNVLGNISVGYLQDKALQAKQYDVMAQRVLDEAGDLSMEVKSELYDELQMGRYDYIWGGKKDKMLSMENLNKKAKTYGDFMELRLDLAELVEDEDALSDHFKNSGEYDSYLDMLKSDARPVNNDCEDCVDKGKPGYVINNKWVSISELRNTIETEGKKDETFKNNLGAMLESYTLMSSKIMPGQVMPFPIATARDAVKNKLIDNATNLKSVAYDKMFGDTSFYDDIREGLQAGKYTDLGIEDPTGGTVTAEDADVMARALINDPLYENVFKNELTNYYTNFFRQNWNNGSELRIRTQEGYAYRGGQVMQTDVEETEETTEPKVIFVNPDGTVSVDAPAGIQGGSVSEDGVWTPNQSE